MDTHSQIIWTIPSADVDSANVRVEQRFVVYTRPFHARDHVLITKVTKCRVIDLNMP